MKRIVWPPARPGLPDPFQYCRRRPAYDQLHGQSKSLQLLVALAEIETIDFPRVRDTLNRDTFPFSELLLVGVPPSGKFVIAGILPREGWSTYDLGWTMN